MSIALLKNLTKAHDILDDLESCFWVLIYAVLHFFANDNTIDPEVFDKQVKKVVGNCIQLTGGSLKSHLLQDEFRTFAWECEPLHDLLHKLRDIWKEYYTLYNNWEESMAPSRKVTASLLAKRADTQAKLEQRRHEMIQPDFWHEIFQEALAMENWEKADAVPDRAPREKSTVHNRKMRERTICSSLMESSMTSSAVGSNLPAALPPLLPPSPARLAELRILANPANSSVLGTAPTGSGSAMYRSQTPPRSHKRTLSDYEPNPEALASPRESKKPRTMSPPVASEWDSDHDCDSLYMDELDGLSSSPLAGKGKGRALPDNSDNEEVSRARTESGESNANSERMRQHSGGSIAETGSVASVEDGAPYVSPVSKTLGFPPSKA